MMAEPHSRSDDGFAAQAHRRQVCPTNAVPSCRHGCLYAYVLMARQNPSIVTLEVSQADEDVGIHDGPAIAIRCFADFDGDFDFIRAPKAVANDDLTCRHRVVAIKVGTVHVFQGMFTAARIRVLQSVKKGRPPNSLTTSATALTYCGRSEARQPSSPKWVDGNEFAFKVDISDAGLLTELLQLL